MVSPRAWACCRSALASVERLANVQLWPVVRVYVCSMVQGVAGEVVCTIPLRRCLLVAWMNARTTDIVTAGLMYVCMLQGHVGRTARRLVFWLVCHVSGRMLIVAAYFLVSISMLICSSKAELVMLCACRDRTMSRQQQHAPLRASANGAPHRKLDREGSGRHDSKPHLMRSSSGGFTGAGEYLTPSCIVCR